MRNHVRSKASYFESGGLKVEVGGIKRDVKCSKGVENRKVMLS